MVDGVEEISEVIFEAEDLVEAMSVFEVIALPFLFSIGFYFLMSLILSALVVDDGEDFLVFVVGSFLILVISIGLIPVVIAVV